LPRKARARIAGQLLKSLDEDDEKLTRKDWNAAWKRELEKRIKDVRSGKVKTIPATQVMAELRAKYG
jgi:putative addiction module component (TIGR02574 family)